MPYCLPCRLLLPRLASRAEPSVPVLRPSLLFLLGYRKSQIDEIVITQVSATPLQSQFPPFAWRQFPNFVGRESRNRIPLLVLTRLTQAQRHEIARGRFVGLAIAETDFLHLLLLLWEKVLRPSSFLLAGAARRLEHQGPKQLAVIANFALQCHGS